MFERFESDVEVRTNPKAERQKLTRKNITKDVNVANKEGGGTDIIPEGKVQWLWLGRDRRK